MAKNVHEAVRQKSAQASQDAPARHVSVGRGVLNFKKDYSQDEWQRIEDEREAMRERLLAEG